MAERLSLRQAVARVPFPLSEPRALPSGFRLISTELVQVGDVQSLNLYFGEASSDLEGQIRLHIEPGTVNCHVNHLLEGLRLPTRHDLAAFFERALCQHPSPSGSETDPLYRSGRNSRAFRGFEGAFVDRERREA